MNINVLIPYKYKGSGIFNWWSWGASRRPLPGFIGIYNNPQIAINISFLLHHSLSTSISNHCKLTYKLTYKLEIEIQIER